MPTRKTLAGRRSVQAKADAPGSAQTPAARRLADSHLRALIAKFAPEYSKLVNATRRRLRARLPSAHEIVYEYRDFLVISYSPSERGYEGVLAVRAGANGVRLYFNRGKDLPDPANVLQGSGNQTRLIVLENPATMTRPEVVGLIEAAIALDPAPFERAGRGSIVIRAAAKPRARRRPAE